MNASKRSQTSDFMQSDVKPQHFTSSFIIIGWRPLQDATAADRHQAQTLPRASVCKADLQFSALIAYDVFRIVIASSDKSFIYKNASESIKFLELVKTFSDFISLQNFLLPITTHRIILDGQTNDIMVMSKYGISFFQFPYINYNSNCFIYLSNG